MSTFEIEGKLIAISDVQAKTESFKVREFVIQVDREIGGTIYSDYLKFQLTQDGVVLIDAFQLNDTVKVSFNLRGRGWTKDGVTSYFNSLDAWKLERSGTSSAGSSFAPANEAHTATAAPVAPAPVITTASQLAADDDLPF